MFCDHPSSVTNIGGAELRGNRRAWQPTGRRQAPGGSIAEERNAEDSEASSAARTPVPDDARSTRSCGVDPMTPDPWSEWLSERNRSSQFQSSAREMEPPTFGSGRPLRHESGSGDSSWGGRNSGNSGGKLSDHEIRNFHVAQVDRMTAMNNGRWAGSYDEGGPGQRGWNVAAFDGGRDQKPTEKISVPEFSGEGTNDHEVGKTARSYVRKVQVWLRCTRLPAEQRALALYSALTEKAWVYAEELDMDILSSPHGVEYFLEWIQTRFMEVEMSKISQMMNDLFRRCKKRPDQSVRDFNVEFERMVLRLHEVRCELPPLVKAWLYVDKLKLTESEELALLASCNNEYDCRKLQQAALIQDRSLRHGFGHSNGDNNKGWKGGRWKQSVHMTMDVDEDITSDENEPNTQSETHDLVDETVAQEHHSAFMAYQGAKARYKEALKGRGTDPEVLKKQADERLRLAKERSFCSVCKRRGHLHKDDICPVRQQQAKNGGGEQSAHVTKHEPHSCHAVTHVCFMTATEECFSTGQNDPSVTGDFLAIIDTACTKSVAGYSWFEEYYKMADALDLPYQVLEEKDHFRFGASKACVSTFAVRAWLAIQGRWFVVKIAIVPSAVPLLFSRPVLCQLGMKYDLSAETISLTSLKVKDLKTQTSSTGHPALLIAQFPESPPPRFGGHEDDEIWVPASEAYMAAPTAAVMTIAPKSKHIFYPKKIPLEVHNMLVGTNLVGVTFYAWWKSANQSNDFWIETDTEMIRVHVIPRRHPFDPFVWNPRNPELKQALVSSIGRSRTTEAVICLLEGVEVINQVDEVGNDMLHREGPKLSF